MNARYPMMLALLVVCSLLPMDEAKPSYVECQNSSDCGAGRCCMLGMNRYSIPTCLPLSQVNEPCRPGGDKSVNTTIYYPDGARLALTNVYRQFCPCNLKLSCSMNNLMCINPETLDNEISQFSG